MPKKKTLQPHGFVNVRVSKTTHKQLLSHTRKDETFDDSIKRLMHDVEFVNFELISIDNKSPEGYSVVYRIGNAKYAYHNGKYSLVGAAT